MSNNVNTNKKEPKKKRSYTKKTANNLEHQEPDMADDRTIDMVETPMPG